MCLKLQMEESPLALTQDEQSKVTPGTDEAIQPEIGVEEEDTLMDDVDEDEEEKELLEDELRRLQKVDSVATIASLRMKPERLSRFNIPLCMLVPMPMVRPTLGSDLVKLEQKFAVGYRDGAAVFYVSTTNEAGESSTFTEDEINSWDPLWKQRIDIFNAYVDSIPELRFMMNMKFYVCDGNHRRLAWMNLITRRYSMDMDWHVAVDCIVLETKGRIELVMQMMHDINK